MRFNVAIVGAGISGSMVASIIAKKGFKVVVLEKKGIGKKVCGGLISKRTLSLIKTEAILNEIRGAEIIFPNKKSVFIGGDKVHAYVIDRQKLDKEIAEKAMSEGAEYKLNFKIKKILRNKIYGKEEIKYDYLIGADGAKSFVAKSFSMGKIKFVNAIQGNAKCKVDCVKVFLGSFSPGFFAWIIPAGDVDRIGMGTTKKGIRQYFNAFLRLLDIEAENIKAGIIPMGLRRFFKGNVALVGDAAGQVKATSGGGIYASLLGAKILGEKFEGEKRDFYDYKKEYMKKFGRELKNCLIIRKFYLKLKDKDLNIIADYVERNVELINKYGDIDYPSILMKKFIKKNPKILFDIIWKRIWQ